MTRRTYTENSSVITEDQAIALHRVTDQELVKLLGKGKSNAMMKHPWFTRYSSWHHAYRYARDEWGFVTVDMFPYMPTIKTADGKIRPLTWVTFKFSFKGTKIVEAQFHIRDKEPSDFEIRNPTTGGWRVSNTWRLEDDGPMKAER